MKIEDPALAGGSVAAIVLEFEVGLGLYSVRGEKRIGPDEETEMERADEVDTVQKAVFDVEIVAGIDHLEVVRNADQMAQEEEAD